MIFRGVAVAPICRETTSAAASSPTTAIWFAMNLTTFSFPVAFSIKTRAIRQPMSSQEKKETAKLLSLSPKKMSGYGSTPVASPRSLTPTPRSREEGEFFMALTKTTTTSRIRIANLCCSMETKLVKELLKPLKGVLDVKVSEVGRIAIVRHTEAVSATLLLATLNAAHLGASLQDVHFNHHDEDADGDEGNDRGGRSQRRLRSCGDMVHRDAGPWTALLVAAAGWTIAMLSSHLHWRPLVQYILVIPCVLVAFSPLALPLLRAAQHFRVDVNVLMSSAVVGALCLGDLAEALGVLLLVLMADRVRCAALDYVAALLDSTSGRLMHAQVAHVLSFAAEKEGGEPGKKGKDHGQDMGGKKRRGAEGGLPTTDVPVMEVRVGDLVLVRAGEQAPVDGVVVHGEAAMDESALTGECMPVEKKAGARVAGGSICQAGALEISCTAPASHSSLRVIQDMVHDIATSQAPSQEMLDRFAAVYTPLVLFLSFGLALAPEVWAVLRGKPVAEVGWQQGLYRGLELLVLACPCALAMATPLPFLTTLAASAARAGVLFKSATALETLSTVQVLACDKTGTLTEGRFMVSGRLTLHRTAKHDPDVVRLLAASVESNVAHRLSAAVVLDALGCVTEAFYSNKEDGPKSEGNPMPKKKLAKVSKLRHMEGVGVEGECVLEDYEESFLVTVGNRALLDDTDLDDPEVQAFLERYQGEAHLFVLVDGVPEMALSLTDRVRAEAPAMLRALADELQVETTLLTGDSEGVAKVLQAKVGPDLLPTVLARLKPRDKLHWIEERQRQPPPVKAAFSSLRRTSVSSYVTVSASATTAPYQRIDDVNTLDELEAAARADKSDKRDHSGTRGKDGKQCIVAMLGDGVNDAPSLRAADVGLAMGEHGMALAVQAADVVLLSDDLSRVPQAIRMSHFVRWIVVQNLFLALGLKIFLMLVIFSGEGRLWEAVASDGLSLMAVILNGLRPLYVAGKFFEDKEEEVVV